MRLTAFTDIALRIVMRLAVVSGDELMTTREIADVLAVPYTHAAKAVARLSELGLVEARRGRGGGLRGRADAVPAARRLPAAGRAPRGAGGLLRLARQDHHHLAGGGLRRARAAVADRPSRMRDRGTAQIICISDTNLSGRFLHA